MPNVFKKAALEDLGGSVPHGIREALKSTREGFGQAPSIESMNRMLQNLESERNRLSAERRGLSRISAADPEIQRLAHQAAFAPIAGARGALDEALSFAASRSASRGLGRSSIAAANQALALRQILNPLIAQATGLESQLLLDVPFRERQFGLQSAGLGSQILGQGFQFQQGAQGLRESAFTQLQRAISQGAAEREFQLEQKSRRGFRPVGRALGGIAGAGLSAFTGGLGGLALSGAKSLFSGGGDLSIPTAETFQPAFTPRERPSGVPTTTSLGPGHQFQQQPLIQI